MYMKKRYSNIDWKLSESWCSHSSKISTRYYNNSKKLHDEIIEVFEDFKKGKQRAYICKMKTKTRKCHMHH